MEPTKLRTAASLSLALLAACGGTDAPANTVVDVAARNPQFTKLSAAIAKAGLDGTLRGAGPFTVFAPTDAAFAALAAAGVDASTLDAATLGAVLKRHVVAGKKNAADVTGSAAQDTLGGSVSVNRLDDGSYYLGGLAKIVQTDVAADNGVIHVIDGVLLPDTSAYTVAQIAAAYPAFATLLSLVKTAGLASGGGSLDDAGLSVTLFAPTGKAFSALSAVPSGDALKSVLLYHVLGAKAGSVAAVAAAAADPSGSALPTLLSGRTVTVSGTASALKVNDANVLVKDIAAKNGVIHLIDKVLIPQTVVDVAAGSPQFSKLAAAVTRAGLAGTLGGAGPFTVFAPTDAAFAALAAAGIDAAAVDTASLGAVLNAHVVSGRQTAKAVTAASSLAALGGNVRVARLDDGSWYLNGVARITSTDVQAANGVIHVIDGVLLPDAVQATLPVAAIATAYPAFSTLLGLAKTAGLASALADASATLTVFAPTNKAFGALAAVPTGAALTNTLLYHLLGIKAPAATAVTVAAAAPPGNQVQTLLSGKKVALSGDASSGLKLNGNARVIFTDIHAQNGVIHLIDQVLSVP